MINKSLLQIASKSNNNDKDQIQGQKFTKSIAFFKLKELSQDEGIPSTYKQFFSFLGQKSVLTAESINLKEEDEEKRTIIHRACYQLKFDIINEMKNQLTIEDVNKIDIYGNSPLILSCKCPLKEGSSIRKNIIEILLEKKAYIHCKEPVNGWTALHWACFNGDIEAVKTLIKHGAVFFLPCISGDFPIDLAGKRQFDIVVSYLVEECINFLDIVGQFDILDPVQMKIGKNETQNSEGVKEQFFDNIKKMTEDKPLDEGKDEEDVDEYYEKTVKVELRLITPFAQTIFLKCFMNHCLYWSCYYHLSEQIINKLLIEHKCSPIVSKNYI